MLQNVGSFATRDQEGFHGGRSFLGTGLLSTLVTGDPELPIYSLGLANLFSFFSSTVSLWFFTFFLDCCISFWISSRSKRQESPHWKPACRSSIRSALKIDSILWPSGAFPWLHLPLWIWPKDRHSGKKTLIGAKNLNGVTWLGMAMKKKIVNVAILVNRS